jgi:hypothetical protein
MSNNVNYLTTDTFFLIKKNSLLKSCYTFGYIIFNKFNINKSSKVTLKNLFIEPTAKTPQVDLNYPSGELIMSGKSIPEHAGTLYENILNWVTEYIKNPRPTTNLRLNLEYFNTSSAIWLAKIVQTLGSIKDSEYTLMIHLYFNIDDYNNMETDDLKDELHPIIHMIGVPTVSLGIKIYGTSEKGEILKESMVLI